MLLLPLNLLYWLLLAPLRKLIGLLFATVVLLTLVSYVTDIGRPRDRFSERYVADSNIFLDLRDRPQCRRLIDSRYLTNPSVTLFLNANLYDEIGGGNDSAGTQVDRMHSLGRSGARILPAATPLPPNADQMFSRYVSKSDVYVLETAYQLRLPVLSTNRRLRSQVMSDPNREISKRYSRLAIINPCGGVGK